MKILMLNSEYPPLGGGQATANKHLYEALQNYPQLEIDIITASADKYFVKHEEKGNIYFLDIHKNGKNIHFQSLRQLLTFTIKSFFKALQLCKNQKYDLVVAWAGVPAGLIAFSLWFFLKTPYIVLVRGADVPFYEDRWLHLDKYIFSWLSPILWKHAKKVIANSKKLKDMAHHLSPKERIEVINNGIDTGFFSPRPKTNQVLTIVSTGRLTERKGYQFLIESLKGLSDVQLVLLGDGNLRKELENISVECKLNVKFLGIQPQNKVVQFLQQADIFCLPSLNEGMSNSLLEAMACGLPVIVTDVGGTQELLNGNGIIVEKKSVKQLREAILFFQNNPEYLEIYGKKSREIAENMGWNIVGEQFLDAFKH